MLVFYWLKLKQKEMLFSIFYEAGNIFIFIFINFFYITLHIIIFIKYNYKWRRSVMKAKININDIQAVLTNTSHWIQYNFQYFYYRSHKINFACTYFREVFLNNILFTIFLWSKFSFTGIGTLRVDSEKQ